MVYRTAGNNLAAVIQSLHHDNLLGITKDCDVGVVGDDNDLATLLRKTQDRNERCIDELTVKIIFGLIDNQRLVAVRREHESQ